MSITLRTVTPDDEPFLRRLHGALQDEQLHLRSFPPPLRESVLEAQYRARHDEYRRRYPNASDEIVLRDGQPIGRMIVDRTGADMLGVDIALLPEHRRAGIGTALIRTLLEEAASEGRGFLLSVTRGSRAVALYERLGFVTVASSSTETHLTMRWQAT
jgi:GNAT superfamily N-acetyltransferase